jgi:hypothetical protein
VPLSTDLIWRRGNSSLNQRNPPGWGDLAEVYVAPQPSGSSRQFGQRRFAGYDRGWAEQISMNGGQVAN